MEPKKETYITRVGGSMLFKEDDEFILFGFCILHSQAFLQVRQDLKLWGKKKATF